MIRTNFRIRVPEVRCIGSDGAQLGVMPTHQARAIAEREGLDLVEISPTAQPPVCRIMDYGKYKYDLEKKEKMARKHAGGGRVKEVKFHVNVEAHDYQTKLRHIREFLSEGHRIKASLYFRGREMAHQELGREVMDRIIRDCAEFAVPEQLPAQMGRALIMMLAPKRAKTGGGAPAPAPRPTPPAPAPAATAPR